jgi:hypothetical protein
VLREVLLVVCHRHVKRGHGNIHALIKLLQYKEWLRSHIKVPGVMATLTIL